MPKRPMTLKVRLPPYHRPRLDWRRQIHKLVWEKMQDASIRYEKKDRILEPIVPNDSQIYRVIIEKSVSPKQGRGKGHLTIKKYKPVNQL